MKARILRTEGLPEHDTSERCFITEWLNSGDDPELSIARARVEPGVTTEWHLLRTSAERYVILEGTGDVEVGDLPAQVIGPGDIVVIPPGVRQRITTTSESPLVFLAICTPRFSPQDYEIAEDGST
jgi:mannose-6-phosphate isomerase-like protein (cupin superfamily)